MDGRLGGAFRAPVPYASLPARIAVFLSGRGSNFEALSEGCLSGEIPAVIAAVVSERPGAPGLEKARRLGLEALAVDRKLFSSREAHEARLLSLVEERSIDLICLAGYMRLLSASFVDRFPLRILNIHPSLLPSFPGKEAQAQALGHGVRITGVTVHFVDAGLDSGPILSQEPVRVEPDDSVASLSERILAVEHRLYRSTLREVLQGGWILNGRSVSFPR